MTIACDLAAGTRRDRNGLQAFDFTCEDNDLMSQRLCREYVNALAETDQYKRLDYGTKTKILEEEGVPKFFWTTSPVCLIVNHWNSHDPIFRGLESRAEFIFFAPDWAEVYREVGKWFWDQEIYDYVWERLDVLREPDVRLFVKAYNRKKAKLAKMTWQKVIDAYVDDELGLAVRRLIHDASFPSNTARAVAFCEKTEANRATFYRRLRQIRRYRPTAKPPRIVLGRTAPPDETRPVDGDVAGDGEHLPEKTAEAAVGEPRPAGGAAAGDGNGRRLLVDEAAQILTNRQLSGMLETL